MRHVLTQPHVFYNMAMLVGDLFRVILLCYGVISDGNHNFCLLLFAYLPHIHIIIHIGFCDISRVSFPSNITQFHIASEIIFHYSYHIIFVSTFYFFLSVRTLYLRGFYFLSIFILHIFWLWWKQLGLQQNNRKIMTHLLIIMWVFYCIYVSDTMNWWLDKNQSFPHHTDWASLPEGSKFQYPPVYQKMLYGSAVWCI